MLYSDFNTFTRDQEHLISSENTFDYIEGFVIINRTGLLNNWRSSFSPQDPLQASQFESDGRTLFCLEVAKYFNLGQTDTIIEVRYRSQDLNFILNVRAIIWKKKKILTSYFTFQEVERLLSPLNYIPSTLFLSEVSYINFLDRVHVSEVKLRSKGLWEVPHPWLNLLIPRSKIHRFAEEVFGNILTDTSNGPILIYPVNKSK